MCESHRNKCLTREEHLQILIQERDKAPLMCESDSGLTRADYNFVINFEIKMLNKERTIK